MMDHKTEKVTRQACDFHMSITAESKRDKNHISCLRCDYTWSGFDRTQPSTRQWHQP